MDDCNDVKPGLIVKTNFGLKYPSVAMMCPVEYKKERRENELGRVRGWLPGHGGDVWFVEHIVNGEIVVAVYDYTEFEEAGTWQGNFFYLDYLKAKARKALAK